MFCFGFPLHDFGTAAFRTGSDAAVMAKKMSTVVHWKLRIESSINYVLLAMSSFAHNSMIPNVHVKSGLKLVWITCLITLPIHETDPTENSRHIFIFFEVFIWIFQSTIRGTDNNAKSKSICMTLRNTGTACPFRHTGGLGFEP